MIVEPKATKSQKGFLCPFCGKSFVSAGILQEHIAQHHGGGYGRQIDESVTLNDEVGMEEVGNEEQGVSIFQDIGEEQDVEAATLDEECDISMKSMNSDVSMNSMNGDVSMKSMNRDVSMNKTNEVDLTDASMNETCASDDDDSEELANKEKVEKLKNVSTKLLYSEDEAEQLDLAKELKSMIVTAEQIKFFGAGFILKTMRTFTKGESGEIIRKLYRRYNRAIGST